MPNDSKDEESRWLYIEIVGHDLDERRALIFEATPRPTPEEAETLVGKIAQTFLCWQQGSELLKKAVSIPPNTNVDGVIDISGFNYPTPVIW